VPKFFYILYLISIPKINITIHIACESSIPIVNNSVNQFRMFTKLSLPRGDWTCIYFPWCKLTSFYSFTNWGKLKVIFECDVSNTLTWTGNFSSCLHVNNYNIRIIRIICDCKIFARRRICNLANAFFEIFTRNFQNLFHSDGIPNQYNRFDSAITSSDRPFIRSKGNTGYSTLVSAEVSLRVPVRFIADSNRSSRICYAIVFKITKIILIPTITVNPINF